jgi:hypothetical protein
VDYKDLNKKNNNNNNNNNMDNNNNNNNMDNKDNTECKIMENRDWNQITKWQCELDNQGKIVIHEINRGDEKKTGSVFVQKSKCLVIDQATSEEDVHRIVLFLDNFGDLIEEIFVDFVDLNTLMIANLPNLRFMQIHWVNIKKIFVVNCLSLKEVILSYDNCSGWDGNVEQMNEEIFTNASTISLTAGPQRTKCQFVKSSSLINPCNLIKLQDDLELSIDQPKKNMCSFIHDNCNVIRTGSEEQNMFISRLKFFLGPENQEN